MGLAICISDSMLQLCWFEEDLENLQGQMVKDILIRISGLRYSKKYLHSFMILVEFEENFRVFIIEYRLNKLSIT